MPPAYEVLLLNTAIPQIQAAQSGDTYVVPRDIAFSAALTLSAGTANGVPYLNASKVVTTGSALTFDGTTFKVQNNNTASPVFQIQSYAAVGTAIANITYDQATDIYKFSNPSTYAGSGIDFGTGASFTTRYHIDTGGTHIWTVSSEAMRLTSTGLGIGTNSPAMKLDVRVSNSASLQGALNLSNSVNSDFSIQLSSSVAQIGTGTSTPIVFATGNAEKMRLDSSGNLGLGVTPSAWSGSQKAIQNGSRSVWSTNGSNTGIGLNVYNDGGANRYIANGAANLYQQDGAHSWYTAPSGTAGNAITFTQAMTLDASGRLLVGSTTATHGTAGYGVMEVNGSSGALYGLQAGGASAGYLYHDGTNVLLANEKNGYLSFLTNSTERARITSGGDFQTSSGNSVMVGGTAARATTAGTNRVDIFDGTAPVGTLANGVSFYSASGEANVMDAAGNATLLSPHDAETNEWIFRSKHTPTGKVLKIDVERLLKFVNDHFGLDAVHEFVEK